LANCTFISESQKFKQSLFRDLLVRYCNNMADILLRNKNNLSIKDLHGWCTERTFRMESSKPLMFRTISGMVCILTQKVLNWQVSSLKIKHILSLYQDSSLIQEMLSSVFTNSCKTMMVWIFGSSWTSSCNKLLHTTKSEWGKFVNAFRRILQM